MCRKWRMPLLVAVCWGASLQTYLTAEDAPGCACDKATIRVATQAVPLPVALTTVVCTLRVTGTLCDGTVINKPFVGEGEITGGIPDYAAAWADAEMQDLFWRMERCDSTMVAGCENNPCNLTSTHESCNPPELIRLPRTAVGAERVEMEAALGTQWYDCEHRCVATNGKSIVVSEISTDPTDACDRSYETLKTAAAAHGGIVAGTVRSSITATRTFRCVARVKARKGKHYYDCELDGTGTTPELATQSLDSSIEKFRAQIDTTVTEVSRQCRSVPIISHKTLVRCLRECETNKPGYVISVGRLGTTDEEAKAAAKAVAEVLADRFDGIKICKEFLEPKS